MTFAQRLIVWAAFVSSCLLLVVVVSLIVWSLALAALFCSWSSSGQDFILESFSGLFTGLSDVLGS